ncbi:hypothetical protein CYMTET_51419 [Cymbomonas tetramitiformis]|uniref:WRKY19-like zinc finger domain-containing protein n=1 Tax=Cymbomonas tetramitiformis TaxID=36881 RepID=A0AAE0ERU7_9CHLO|nr:hypothetical protein CYMTET_51419 [Cymbomonas tetramitiformis]
MHRRQPRGADLEHGPDKLRGRQLLSFFADYGWYVGRVMGCRSHSLVGHLFIVRYTDGDEEELTWRQLCPKLLPTAPVSEEEAGIEEWAHVVTAAAQAPPSSALEGDMEPQAAGGSVNTAGIFVVKPPVCRFDVSTLQPPLAMADGTTDVDGHAVAATTSDDRGDHLNDRALAAVPAVKHWYLPHDPTAAPANPMAATLGSVPRQQVVSGGALRASVEVTSADENHKADDKRPTEAAVPDLLAAVAENFAAEVRSGAPTAPAGVAAALTLPEDIAEVAGNATPCTEAAPLAARCTSAAESTEFCAAQIEDRPCQADACTITDLGSAKIKLCQANHCTSTGYCFAHGGGKRCQADGCTKSAQGSTGYCFAHGGGKRCQADGCTVTTRGSTKYCLAHGGGKRCQADGCTKAPQGSTVYCVAHGGGKRCQAEGCTVTARGNTEYCIAHGGGKRCQADGCTNAARGSTKYCKAHGGGKRCQADGCTKSARGSTGYCIAHGGGKRCHADGCTNLAQGSSGCCITHGGGKRCQADGCTKSAVGSTEYCIARMGGKAAQADDCTVSCRAVLRIARHTGEASAAKRTDAPN